MQVHLGCGKKVFKGFINVDILAHEGVVQDDISVLKSIPDGSSKLIYACHVLEHFGREEVDDILKLWRRKLIPGGILRIAVPDFGKVVDEYIRTKELPTYLGFLVGGQRDQYDYHKMVFDKQLLTEKLLSAGFSAVNEWEWREVDHGHYDDYSQAYLPHMDKDNGTLMSLNLEAVN